MRSRRSNFKIDLESELRLKREELQMLQEQLERSEKCSPPEIVIKKYLLISIIDTITFKMSSDPLISRKLKHSGKCECIIF